MNYHSVHWIAVYFAGYLFAYYCVTEEEKTKDDAFYKKQKLVLLTSWNLNCFLHSFSSLYAVYFGWEVSRTVEISFAFFFRFLFAFNSFVFVGLSQFKFCKSERRS